MNKTIRANLFIRDKRFRKKLHLNMMGLKVLFDVTTTIYSLILVVYLVAAFFITSDILEESHDVFVMIEEQARNHFWFILSVLPFRYIMGSFQEPGIIFSTSEHKMSMLPHDRGKIWLFSSFIKWSKNVVLYIFIGGLVSFVTPISFSLIIAYIIILFGYDILFTVPVWKLFQERVSMKLAFLGGVMFISIIAYLLESPFIGLVIPLLLTGAHLLLIPKLFHNINWGRVTEVSDFKIWRMFLVSQATKSSYKRSKRYSIFRQSKRRKRAFKYTHQAIHHRLWLIYFGKNIELVLKLVGALLLLLSVLAFTSNLYFHVGIAISIYMYSNISASFFNDRLQSDILRVLPWDLTTYKQTYLKWVVCGASIILLPIVIYGIIHWTMWRPVQWLLYGCAFIYMYHVKIDKTITILSKQLQSFELDEGVGFFFLAVIVASSFYPAASLAFIICVLFFKRRTRQRHHTLG